MPTFLVTGLLTGLVAGLVLVLAVLAVLYATRGFGRRVPVRIRAHVAVRPPSVVDPDRVHPGLDHGRTEFGPHR